MANIGAVKVRQTNRTTIASSNFSPKPNVSLNEVNGVTTTGAQDGYALVYNATTGQFEPQTVSAATTIEQITGGTF